MKRRLACVVLMAAGISCKGAPPPEVPQVPVVEEKPPAPPPEPPLYEKLGGHDGVSEIVESFVSNVMADKRVKQAFAKTTGPKLEYFKAMLAAQLCELSAGGCEYTGKTMKDAHAGMKVTDAQFDAIVQDLTLALQEKQVPAEAQKALLDKLGALRDDIVTVKSKP